MYFWGQWNGRILSPAWVRSPEGDPAEPLKGELRVPADLKKRLFWGAEIAGEGHLVCDTEFKNPSNRGDFRTSLSLPTLRLKKVIHSDVGTSRKSSARWVGWLNRKLQGHPGVHGWVFAVWTGETHSLPFSLRVFYREAGLLAVLALSGQHVSILLGLCRFLAGIFFWAQLRVFPSHLSSRFYCAFLRLLPLVCAGVLFSTSQGAGPIARTAGMWGLLWILRQRRRDCSALQLTFSACAILILCDPALAAQPGFLLSACALALLAKVPVHPGATFDRRYFVVSLLLPVLLFPWSAFLFGRIAWLGPVFGLLVGWLWEFVLIPGGFLVPLVFLLPDVLEPWLLGRLEAVWQTFVHWHSPFFEEAARTYQAVPRLSWLEGVLIDCVILVWLQPWLKRLERRV